ncbi:hypothetical protein F5Y15DRAFT_411729 [Xylariaceae sp. FL0016]|nr:hypothetical protein F5Y15DRAFT_411729 [Xylariaceae sp. FL0016]
MEGKSRDFRFLARSLKYIAADLYRRSHMVGSLLKPSTFLLASAFPRHASAFHPIIFDPPHTLNPEQEAAVLNYGGGLDVVGWVDRGKKIRAAGHDVACASNLTVALETVSQLYQAEYNGAAGALGLLPTAGALLGAPTREILGGSITPSNVRDYDPDEPFFYGGFMPTSAVSTTGRSKYKKKSHSGTPLEDPFGSVAEDPDIESFANDVDCRAQEEGGSSIFLGIWIAMVAQAVLIAALLVPMYYAQTGSVIVWWCGAWWWMWFWCFLVSLVAIFDNLVAAPFTKSWTIRVSRAPTGIIIDENASKVFKNPQYPNGLDYI